MLTKFHNWNNSKKIASSFIVVILIGSILLSLPISQLATSEAGYFQHLFHAVSMVCVTGLVITPMYETYSVLGQTISMVLMQIGGLGLMTLVASALITFGKRMRLRERLAVQAGLNMEDATDLKSFFLTIIKYTFFIQMTGFSLLSFRFVPEFGWGKGLFTSLFLAISGFNNAGFDNVGASSLIPYVHDPLVNIVITSLIILGGIGFSVWFDVARNTKQALKHPVKKFSPTFFRNLSLHTRLALIMTGLLIGTGTIFFFMAEYNNPDSIGSFTFSQKWLASFFQTVTMRTAGFATIDYTTVTSFSLFWFILTMFIGGSPGGTAGGLKTTTFAMVVLLFYNEIRGQKNVNLLHHTISSQLIRNAIVIFIAFLLAFLFGVGILSILNPEVDFIYLLFEGISALATVGVSANLTPSLETPSHIVLMFMMFAGRIGPITLMDSLIRKNERVKDVQYSKGNILIG